MYIINSDRFELLTEQIPTLFHWFNYMRRHFSGRAGFVGLILKSGSNSNAIKRSLRKMRDGHGRDYKYITKISDFKSYISKREITHYLKNSFQSIILGVSKN